MWHAELYPFDNNGMAMSTLLCGMAESIRRLMNEMVLHGSLKAVNKYMRCNPDTPLKGFGDRFSKRKCLNATIYTFLIKPMNRANMPPNTSQELIQHTVRRHLLPSPSKHPTPPTSPKHRLSSQPYPYPLPAHPIAVASYKR